VKGSPGPKEAAGGVDITGEQGMSALLGAVCQFVGCALNKPNMQADAMQGNNLEQT
jgi:hypothetical protein